MRYLSKILILTVTVVILTLSLALAGSKFPNKDTAKNRQDNVMGTQAADDGEQPIIIEKNERGDDSIKTKREKKEEVDWYDKIPIIVEPQITVDP